MFEGKVYSGVATPVTYDDPFPLRLCEAQEKSLPDNQPKKTRKNVLIYIYISNFHTTLVLSLSLGKMAAIVSFANLIR